LRGSFGAGHYAMCGKAYDPRFIFAWPTARYAVMSGDAAAGTLVEIKLKQLEREGKKVDEKAKKELYESVRATYEHQTDPRYAAARLWVDAIIDPAHTRDALINALEAAALNPRSANSRRGSADVSSRRTRMLSGSAHFQRPSRSAPWHGQCSIRFI